MMPNKVEWNNENVEKLIEMYRSRPCLWKLNHEHYTNKNIKKRMFDEIVEAFRADIPGVDVNKVKTRIQNMRSVCRKEWKKVLQSERSGTSEEDVYKPSLWYYPLFEFTRDQDCPLDSVSNLDTPSTLQTSEVMSLISTAEDEDGEGGEDENQQFVPGDEGRTQQTEEQVFKDPPPKVPKRASKDGIEKDVSAFLKTCTTALSVPTEPLDDCGALGTYVAQKLRKMDENQQALAEQLLTKIVTKGLRKRLTENTDVVESTPYPYQGNPAPLYNTTTSTTTQLLPPEAASPGDTSDSAGSSLAKGSNFENEVSKIAKKRVF